MSAELVPGGDLSPAERVIGEIEAAKAAGDIGRVLDGVEGLDAIQRFLRRRKQQRDIANRAGAEKVRVERWIGLCLLNGQVDMSDLRDLPPSQPVCFRFFAKVPEADFEQAISDLAASDKVSVTTNSLNRLLRDRLDPAAEKRRRATAKRRVEERRLRDLGRREMARQRTKAHRSRVRARPLEVALGAVHDALRALEEFEVRDENERVAYDEALRMFHGAEDFIKIVDGHVYGSEA